MRRFLTVIICLFYIPCYCQFSFNITLNTSTLNGRKIFLYLLDNNSLHTVKTDSMAFKDNQIQFRGRLKFQSNFARFSIFEHGKNININFVIDTCKSDVNLEITSTGPEKLLLRNLNTKSNHIYQELDSITKFSFGKASTLSGQKNEIIMNTALYTEMLRKLVKSLETYPTDFFSVLALYRLSHYDHSPEYAKSVLLTLATFSNENRYSMLGKEIFDEQTKLIIGKNSAKIGNKVLEFSVRDIHDKIFNNKSLQGQNYIIAFSATWCLPCQTQLPKLKRIYQDYKSKGLKVVYFNNDDDHIKWNNHVLKNDLNWINVSEGLKPSRSKIQRSFGIYAIPSYLLIGKNGTIVYNSDQNDIEINDLEKNVRKLYDKPE
jgi:thiol-disulfide isomerase/thioredoxin